MNLEKYQLASSSRVRENIEWSMTYAYNAPDRKSPRILLIGDSICKAYHTELRRRLQGRANLTFWASSKCVTDPDYLRELDFITNGGPFSLILFNNGIHAMTSPRQEWQEAYAGTVRFLKDKFPGIPLFIVLSTPSRDASNTEIIRAMNQWNTEYAQSMDLPVIDLFAPAVNLDRSVWSDDYHFLPETVLMLAEIVAEKIADRFAENGLQQKMTLTGPDGSLK